MIRISFTNGEASISDAITAATSVMLASKQDIAEVHIFAADCKTLYTIELSIKDAKLVQRIFMCQAA